MPEAAAVAAQRLAVLLPEAARVRHVVLEHGDGLRVAAHADLSKISVKYKIVKFP